MSEEHQRDVTKAAGVLNAEGARAKRSREVEDKPLVSIILATYNERENIVEIGRAHV